MKQPHILIVNPVPSASYLSEMLKQAGIRNTALYTIKPETCPAYCANNPTDFDHQQHMEDRAYDDIARFVEVNRFDFIMNGFEHSTALTDRLSSRFTPDFANNPATSQLREDKYEMQNAVHRAGLPSIKQLRVTAPLSPDVFDTIFTKLHLPVFCKPTAGVGSIGAFAAFTEGELKDRLRDAFKAGAIDYLAQQLVRGTEYAIDTFSAAGQHHVCGVLRYQKEFVDQSPLYRSVFVEQDPDIGAQCATYAGALLQALDVKFGFAHIEIMIESDGTIRLMELNNRISGGGGILNRLCSLSGLNSQVDALRQFTLSGAIPPPRTARIPARGLFLYRFMDGVIRDPRTMLERFQTVRHVLQTRPAGSHFVRRPHLDLNDVACLVTMQARSEDELEHDAQAIFRLEAAGELL